MPEDQTETDDVPEHSPDNNQPQKNGSWTARLKSVFSLRPTSLRESLEDVLEDDGQEDRFDAFSAKERSMLRNVLGLRDLRVDDVMVPRADIEAVEDTVIIADLLRLFREAGHSRLPVYNDTLDDPLGMVHIKDLMGAIATEAELSPEELARRKVKPSTGFDMRKVNLKATLKDAGLMREVLFVPPSMPAGGLLVKMQATRIHLAIVVDEYGGTDGLVSIEDLVEEIVGEIEDEHDEESAPMIVPAGENEFVADARTELEGLEATLGGHLEFGEDAEEVDTLGGLVFSKVGRVPVRGELIDLPGDYELEILDADPRRIKRVRIYPKPSPGARRRAQKPVAQDGHDTA